MSRIELLLKELDQESKTTRRMLERVPVDKADWQPHPKSMKLISLATHVAELPAWVTMVLTTDELDFASNPYKQEPISSNEDLLAYFERSLQSGREHLANADEAEFAKLWTLREGDTIYDTSSKYDVMRMSFSQIIHHRAQLGVYLRLLDIPIPGSYGPSADEVSFAAETA
ncbi:DinB family protein [Desertivirga xinjiangensis]|uniref:DinB family protein n=1 Tax=Desertivirga xinjiangensis TaxID=539206 RepID=UPI00210E8E10|nr:DinB family protein [Pedobacter xinjiangensis]